MVKISEEFGGEYITADKLKKNPELKGELEILMIKLEKFKDDPKEKLNVIFSGRDESLILNKTNALIIAETLGDNTDEWTGSRITLKLGKTMFNNKLVDAVLVDKVIKSSKPETA